MRPALIIKQTSRPASPPAPVPDEHMLTVQARLGMVLALLGQYGPAKELLHEVAPPLREYRGSTEALQRAARAVQRLCLAVGAGCAGSAA